MEDTRESQATLHTLCYGLYAVMVCPCEGYDPDCSCRGRGTRAVLTNIELEYQNGFWVEKGKIVERYI